MKNLIFNIILVILCFMASLNVSAETEYILGLYLGDCHQRHNRSLLDELLDDIELNDLPKFKNSLSELKSNEKLTRDGANLLACSMYYDRENFFEYLLGNGYSPDFKFKNTTLLHLSIRIKNVYFFKALLKHGANPNILDDRLHYPPLFSLYLDGEKTELLIKSGADLGFTDVVNDTPLINAVLASQKNLDSIVVMLRYGAYDELESNGKIEFRRMLDYLKLIEDTPIFKQRKLIYKYLDTQDQKYLVLIKEIINEYNEINKENQQCLDLQNVNAASDPVKLYQILFVCLNEDRTDKAIHIFSLAKIYGRFDILRVKDVSSHQIAMVLQQDLFYQIGDEVAGQFTEKFTEYFRRKSKFLDETCQIIRKIGPPQYRPDYMINHGMSVMLGKNEDPVKEIDVMTEWNKLLDNYLHCY